jgi:hypothetical protein
MNTPKGEVVDAHGHIMEPTNLWIDYIDPKFQERALRFARSADGIDHMLLDNRPSPYSYGVAPFMAAPDAATSWSTRLASVMPRPLPP